MAIFGLSAHQTAMLASCISIGLEGAAQNHTDNGGDNSDDDVAAIAALLDELLAIPYGAEVTVMAGSEHPLAHIPGAVDALLKAGAN